MYSYGYTGVVELRALLIVTALGELSGPRTAVGASSSTYQRSRVLRLER